MYTEGVKFHKEFFPKTVFYNESLKFFTNCCIHRSTGNFRGRKFSRILAFVCEEREFFANIWRLNGIAKMSLVPTNSILCMK